MHPHLPCTEDASHAAAPARILGSIVRNASESALHVVLISQCICRAVPILHFVNPLAILGRLHPLQAMTPLCSTVLSANESAQHAEATVVVLFCHFCVFQYSFITRIPNRRSGANCGNFPFAISGRLRTLQAVTPPPVSHTSTGVQQPPSISSLHSLLAVPCHHC